jgi:hypothetical protein
VKTIIINAYAALILVVLALGFPSSCTATASCGWTSSTQQPLSVPLPASPAATAWYGGTGRAHPAMGHLRLSRRCQTLANRSARWQWTFMDLSRQLAGQIRKYDRLNVIP